MSQLDAVQFREFAARLDRLESVVDDLAVIASEREPRADEIATLKLRLSSLQGQINSLRALLGRTGVDASNEASITRPAVIPEPPPDAPANSSSGESDAARQ